MFYFIGGLPAVHARFDVILRDVVPLAFTPCRFLPPRLFLTGRGRKSNRAHTQHHKERAADDLRIEGSAAAVQFAKNENSPKQSPELVGIRKRDAAADADILRGVLLKQVSDNPDEASEHQPEKHVARAHQFAPQRSNPEITDRKRRHHSQFAEREKRDERKRIHPRQVGLAVRNIHRAPQNARAERRPNAAQRMRRGTFRGRGDREQGRANAHNQRSAQYAGPAPPARLTQFIEEKKSPEDAEKAVRIPEWKRNAQTDVANGEDGQRVRHRPKTTGEERPDNQMRRAADIGADGRSAEDQSGEAPARQKNADDHDERNHHRGNTDGDEFRRRFG